MMFVIGDGCISHVGRTANSNGELTFEHGPSQESYLVWKLKILSELGFSVGRKNKFRRVKNEFVDKVYPVCLGWAKSHIVFTKIHNIAYPNKIKTYHDGWINSKLIDPLAMAVWWMDDGCKYHSKQSASIAGVLNCCCDEREILIVKDVWENILQSETTINRKKNNYNLRLPAQTYRRMVKLILPYVHESMIYKCSLFMGEDGKPIIPINAEQLKQQLDELKI